MLIYENETKRTVPPFQNDYAVLGLKGKYTQFFWKNMTISFLHGKDLMKYLRIKEWDQGYLVVDCLGKVKGVYEDYIDLSYILENLYMDAKKYLEGVKGVTIQNAGGED